MRVMGGWLLLVNEQTSERNTEIVVTPHRDSNNKRVLYFKITQYYTFYNNV